MFGKVPGFNVVYSVISLLRESPAKKILTLGNSRMSGRQIKNPGAGHLVSLHTDGVRKGSGVANVSFEDVKVFLQHLLPRLPETRGYHRDPSIPIHLELYA